MIPQGLNGQAARLWPGHSNFVLPRYLVSQFLNFVIGSLRKTQAVRALVIAPKTLLAHWEKELRVCGLGAITHSFYGSSEGERAAALRAVTGRGGVMLTTYGMVLHNAQQLKAGLGPAARGKWSLSIPLAGYETVTRTCHGRLVTTCQCWGLVLSVLLAKKIGCSCKQVADGN